MKSIEEYVTTIPDFPEKGIMFRDVTTVIKDPDGYQMAVEEMQKKLEGEEFDVIVAPESRGYFFASPIACNLHKPLIPIRKKGKLPRETVSASYDLEYGQEEIEMHKDDLVPGQKVVIIDDLIATGGTVEAMIGLVESLGGIVVDNVFLMELMGLNARDRLSDYKVQSVIQYPGK